MDNDRALHLVWTACLLGRRVDLELRGFTGAAGRNCRGVTSIQGMFCLPRALLRGIETKTLGGPILTNDGGPEDVFAAPLMISTGISGSGTHPTATPMGRPLPISLCSLVCDKRIDDDAFELATGKSIPKMRSDHEILVCNTHSALIILALAPSPKEFVKAKHSVSPRIA